MIAHPQAVQADLSIEGRPLDVGAVRAGRAALLAAGAGLGGSVLLGAWEGWDALLRSYLLNYCYFVSLALGAMFFVLLQHLTRAGWSVVVRRVAEIVMNTMPVWAIAFLPLLIPVLAGMEGLYPWSSAARVQADHLLEHKRPYLNVPFFVVRCGIYLAAWVWLSRWFFRRSVEQDESGDVGLTLRMQRLSAPAMFLYAFSLTFFSFDLMMSLNPHWYSTIFGVYYFSGSVVGFFALLAVLLNALQAAGRLRHTVTAEHYHDVGKLIFAFVVFWTYIAFSQYMLQWYANLPEETQWYSVRQSTPWWVGVSLLLLFGKFLAPFLAIMARQPKRTRWTLALVASWVLLMQWVDVYYLVAPRPYTEHLAALQAGTHRPLHLTDLACLIGLAGVFVWAMVRQMARVPLLPQRDPRLPESLAFENV